MKNYFRRTFLAGLLATAPLYAQNVGYVVDNAGGQVLVVDLGAQAVQTTIPVGAQASEMFTLPNNRFAFVSNQGDNTVSLLDLQTNMNMANIPTGQGPGSLIASPDGRFLYVANDTSNDVTVIDVAARQAVETIPVGASPIQVNLSRDGKFAYTVDQYDSTVSVIDTNRNTVVKTVPVGMQPNQFAILPNLNVAYVVNKNSNNLSLFDLTQNEVTGTVSVGQAPVSVAFSSDSRYLYVVNSGSNDISVVDTQRNSETKRIPVGTNPVAMVVTFDGLFGYVSNQGSNTVSVLDLTLKADEKDIPVGVQPFSLMLDPNENFLYVTNINPDGSGTVSVINVSNDQVVKTISAGGSPVQFTMLNAPTLLELAPNPVSASGSLTLNGESFLPGSVVRVTQNGPPKSLVPQFLDSQGLQVTVPPSFSGSAIVDVLNPDGNSSEQLTLQSGFALPSIDPGGVVEAAGFARAPSPISGNTIVAIFGSFPGMTEGTAAAFPLPREFGNAKVTFNGVPTPLFGTYPLSNQINALAPVRLFGLPPSVRVAVTVGGQTSAVETVNVAATSPGIFVIAAGNVGAFRHALTGAVVTPENPARRYDPSNPDPIAMFVTGLGDTTPEPVEGEGAASDVLSYSALRPIVMVGSAEANTSFWGLTPTASGLYQINFDVPANAPTGNAVPVKITFGEQTSNIVNLAVQ